MNAILVIFKKELFSYCTSPVSWVIGFVFYLWRGYEVRSIAAVFSYYRSDPELLPAATYGLSSTFLMVMLVPGILTMRTFAEERRTGSIETLMTAPVRDVEVVLGKWFAAAVFFALLWLPSVVVLHLLEYEPFLAVDLSFGPVLAAYLGMFLLSGMLLAALLTIMFDFGLLRLPSTIAAELGETAQKNVYVRELLDKFDVMRNFSEWFARGLIDSSQVAFYLGGIAFFLFLTTTSLSSRRIA